MKRISVPVILAFCILLLTGCGGGSGACEDEAYYMAETAAASAYVEGYADGSADLYSGDYDEIADAEKSYTGGGSYAETDENAAIPVQTERKLIRTVDISLQTENFDLVTDGIVCDVSNYGGYIESSNYYLGGYNSQNNRSANICARVPADKCDAFLSRSYENTYVEYRNENTEDVSLQYTDLETRLSTLEAERDRLQELIREAEDMESLVVLEERLSEIRYELESIHTSLRNYDNKVDYTTVWIYINEVKKIDPPAEAGFGERIRDGFTRSTEALGNALEDAAVWFLSNILTILLVLVLIGLQVFIILAIVRGARKRHLAKKQKKTQDSAAMKDHNPTETSEKDLKAENAGLHKKNIRGIG